MDEKDKVMDGSVKEQVRVFQKLFNSTVDIVVCLDMDLRVIAYNNALIENFYIRREDVIGKNLKHVFETKAKGGTKRIDEIWPKMERAIKETLQTGKPTKVFENLYADSGESVFFNIIVSPILDENDLIQGTIVTARDVSKEIMLSNSLRERNELLACILDNLPLYAFLKNRNGEFVMGSSAFTNDLMKEKKLSFPLANKDVFEPPYAQIVTDEENELFRSKKMLDIEREIKFINKSFLCRIHKSPLFDEIGDVKYLVVMCEDITEKKEIENQREYFIKTLIHDMRVPTIAQLRGMELLSKGVLGTVNAEQSSLISEIMNSCNYVLEMISMVLSAYRLENGEKRLVMQTFGVEELLRDCSRAIKKKGHGFSYTIKPKNLKIYGDKSALQNVVVSLISTHSVSSASEFEISVSVKRDDICFTITRPGIAAFGAKENVISLSELLSNAKFTTVGYGVGLYMCKKIIDLHKGDIFASSDGANINEITFTIPYIA